MSALSLWQPWASLWCSERKVHETRHCRCSHRGWLLVHAAKRFEKDFALDDPLCVILDDELGSDWTLNLPTGALIGIVNVVDCVPTRRPIGDATANDDDRQVWRFFGWTLRLETFRLFDVPIPYGGAQGIFNVPDDLIARCDGSRVKADKLAGTTRLRSRDGPATESKAAGHKFEIRQIRATTFR